jgi:dihydroorotase
MNFLLQNGKWAESGHPNYGQNIDIRICNGVVDAWDSALVPQEGEPVFNLNGDWITTGFVDLQCRLGAPGKTENESLDSFFKAAAAGGYTKVQITPDTKPVLDSIESVYFYSHLNHPTGVQILVSAAATQGLERKKMAEILRLRQAGAQSFSSVHPIENNGFFCRLLQYIQHSGAVLFHNPNTTDLFEGGQMHEGVVSDRRGLEGIPSLSEILMVQRDISALEYAGGKLHLSCLSSSEGVKLALGGRRILPGLSFSIAGHQLAFNHEVLDNFDTTYKVFPPFRLEEDRVALVESCREGLDVIVSDHRPLHSDYKVLEFDNAGFGISSLETTFSTVSHFVPGISAGRISELFSQNPRQILELPLSALKVGAKAEFTVFSLDKIWTPSRETWQSKSTNSPFFGQPLKGAIQGIATETGFHPHPRLTLLNEQP